MKQSDRDLSQEVSREIENFGLQVARYNNKEIPEEKIQALPAPKRNLWTAPGWEPDGSGQDPCRLS